jgi:hypothetical protein
MGRVKEFLAAIVSWVEREIGNAKVLLYAGREDADNCIMETDIIAFGLALGKKWWVLMSCALFTGLGMWVLYADKSNAWATRATFSLAGFCLLVACYLAWHDEHARVAVLEDETRKLQDKYFGQRPLLGIETHSVEGPKAWREHAVPVTFSVHHLSGRVPTAICFDPVPSLLGKFLLHFDAIPHAEKHPKGIRYRVEQVGAPRLGAHDLEKIGNIEGELLRLFLDDSPPELMELSYNLIVHFKDGEEKHTQFFRVTFDKGRFRFLPNTAI